MTVTLLTEHEDEPLSACRSRFDSTARRGFVFCRGAGVDNWAAFTNGEAAGLRRLLHGIVRGPIWKRPYLGVTTPQDDPALDEPDLTWGNAVSVGHVDDAVDWLHAHGVSGRVVIVGASMGHVVAWNYAKAHPDDVAGIVGINPACDLDFHRGTDAEPGDWWASINDAYDVETDAEWAAIRDDVDPAVHATADVACLLAWNDDDAVIGAPTVQEAFAVQVDATVHREATGGHFTTGLTAAQVLAWADTLDWEAP